VKKQLGSRRPLAAVAVAITLGFGALGLARAPHAAAAPAFPTICADLDRDGDPTATFDRARVYGGNQGWTYSRLKNEVVPQLWAGCPNRVGDWVGWAMINLG
jgi:hypothetical protein